MVQRISVLLFIALIGTSCHDEKGDPVVSDPEIAGGTWDVIQSRIFEAKCVSCHRAGNTFATQSGLILTADVAYEQLINVIPKNQAAADNQLVRVGRSGLPSLSNSFLWEKINAPNFEHFYSDHPEYGELMPLNLPPLTNGELEFIRQWIIKRAPEAGSVVSEDILLDSTIFLFPNDSFQAPAQPAQGIQLHLEQFPVAPNYERELFKYQLLGNTEDLYMNRIQIQMRKGSHHFILYDFAPGATLPALNDIRDLRYENGTYVVSTLLSMQDQIYFFGTQLRITDYTFPPGVALKIPANKALDFNSHYANYTNDTVTGEVYVNVHTIDRSEVVHEAQNLFLNNTSFILPANQVTTLTEDYRFSNTRKVFMLTSHAHQQMLEFKIRIKGGARDGELVYFTDDWEHPPLMKYDPPITLNPGEGLTAEATYDNNTNRNLTFGFLSTDEMMIIFGAYYEP